MSKNPILRLDNVSRLYPNGAGIRDATIHIDPGEFLAVVGPSGSGKSTLLTVMGTLARPTAGQISIDGMRVNALNDARLSALRAQRIGFVFQHSHLAERLSAAGNVATGLLYAGIPRRDRTARAIEALEQVGLGHRVDHFPHQLSGGERQRVGIARALANQPALILADEPTGALDSHAGANVLALFHDLNRNGSTVALVTHDRSIAESIPRRITISDGRVVADT